MKLFVELIMLDKTGGVIKHFPKCPAHSFVKNLYNLYCYRLLGVTPSEANDLDFRDTNGVSRSQYSATYDEGSMWRGNELVSKDTGILVGSGDTEEDFGMGVTPNAMSYRLDTIIVNGSEAGELERAASGAPVITTEGAGPVTWTVVWTRYFNNNSGGDVTVREIGVYQVYGMYRVMLTRDVLDSPVIIADTGQLKVEYTLEIDFPGVSV